MQPNYTEQDTELARQREHAANTAVPAPTYAQGGYPAASTMRNRNNTLAIGLIALGALLVLGRFGLDFGDFTAGMILLTISSCFLFFAFAKRVFGLLIPGSILAGLAVGVPFADLTNGTSVLWGLALGFFAIAMLGRTLFRVNSSWAMIPSVILFAVGVIVLLANLPGFLGAGLIWLPLLLVAAGLYLGWGRRVVR
jgi:hypothetical protein